MWARGAAQSSPVLQARSLGAYRDHTVLTATRPYKQYIPFVFPIIWNLVEYPLGTRDRAELPTLMLTSDPDLRS